MKNKLITWTIETYIEVEENETEDSIRERAKDMLEEFIVSEGVPAMDIQITEGG